MSKTATEQLWKLVETGECSDSTIIVTDANTIQEFKVHKLIIKNSSPLLLEKQGQNGIINIEDVSSLVMRRVLRHIYGCKIEDDLDLQDLINLLFIADKYFIKSLQEECSDVINKKFLNIKNLPCLLINSLLLPSKLKAHCYKMLQENTLELFNDYLLVQISEETLLDILDFEQLALRDELNLILFVERWALDKIEKTDDTYLRDYSIRKIIEKNILSKLRFLTLKEEQLTKMFSKIGWLSSEERKSILEGIKYRNWILPFNFPPYLSKAIDDRCFRKEFTLLVKLGDIQNIRNICDICNCSLSFTVENYGCTLLGLKLIGGVNTTDNYINILICDQNEYVIDSFYEKYSFNNLDVMFKFPIALKKHNVYYVKITYENLNPLYCYYQKNYNVRKVSHGITISAKGQLGPISAIILKT